MYIQRNKNPGRKNNFPKALLMESFRDENGKSRKRTLLNLANCSDETINALEFALKHSSNLSSFNDSKDIQLSSGIQFAPQFVIYSIIKSLGIDKVLGNSHQAKLALWQIIARVMEQGSRMSAVRLARDTASDEILNFEKEFCEDDLYKNLTWLADNQEEIENKLFENRGDKSSNLFLYDVTSSYLEGRYNELAEYGYNRDKKKGKKQLVIGLLTDSEGFPLSIQAFKGNTGDTKTIEDQIKKVSERFKCENITMVGDKGMIKTAGIESLNSRGFHYITTITKPQIEGLLKAGIIQLNLFDDEMVEIIDKGTRYILRRNRFRAEEIERSREERINKLKEMIELENQKTKKAKMENKLKRLKGKAKTLKIEEWVGIKEESGVLKIEIDEEKRKEKSKLDGCFVIKSDLGKEVEAKTIYERYKDLIKVENAFRSMKTVELELRPVFVIKEKSTRGHLMVVMLSYMIILELKKKWKNIDLTVSEGIDRLKSYSTVIIEANGGKIHKIPKPEGIIKELIEPLGIEIPLVLPARKIIVLTRKTIANRN